MSLFYEIINEIVRTNCHPGQCEIRFNDMALSILTQQQRMNIYERFGFITVDEHVQPVEPFFIIQEHA